MAKAVKDAKGKELSLNQFVILVQHLAVQQQGFVYSGTPGVVERFENDGFAVVVKFLLRNMQAAKLRVPGNILDGVVSGKVALVEQQAVWVKKPIQVGATVGYQTTIPVGVTGYIKEAHPQSNYVIVVSMFFPSGFPVPINGIADFLGFFTSPKK